MTEENPSGQQQGGENQGTHTNTKPGAVNGAKDFKAITTQDEFDRAIRDRLDRQKGTHADEIATLQKQIDDLKSSKSEKSGDTPDDDKKSPLEKQIEEMQRKFDDLQAEKKAASDAEDRLSAVKAEKLDPAWAELIGGADASEWKANAKKVRELISKSKPAPDTNTGNQTKGPRNQPSNGVPEFKYRARGKQVSLS